MFYSKSTGGFYDRTIHPGMPADAVEISAEQHAALLVAEGRGKRIVAAADGTPIAVDPPPPTPEQIAAALAAAVQAHLDAAAQARGYDDIRSACTYADEPAVARFQAEGKAFRAWRSRVWEKCYAILAECQAGTRAAPTAVALIVELPTVNLP